MFANVELYFSLLKQFSPGRGYYPKPSKVVLIMYPDNIKYRKRFVLCYGFKFCTDANYLGGFIGGDESKRD